jgi:EAL domain-containing protein (putative c-di-GMP-specific phosphodiesterase class I)
MKNPEQSVPLMWRLKNTGVALSIDDFGTGFSNLSYLRRFPVDRLKIDLSFVREITTDPGSLAISEAIITMSHSLNLQVVAEGVETEGQLELLGARNCDLIQGYYFSPPVTADAFATLLREDRRLPRRPVMHQAPAMLM